MLRRKSPPLDTPWGALDLVNPAHRAGIAAAVSELDLDLLIIGPLNDLGMEGGGTPDEVRKFIREETERWSDVIRSAKIQLP